MLRILALLFGAFFILSGILGFIPEFVSDGKLFGIFAISTMRNFIHLAIGFLGLLSGLKGSSTSKLYFIVFGIFFLILAAVGLYHSTGEVFHYLIANNADNWLHALLALLFLYIGIFFFRKR